MHNARYLQKICRKLKLGDLVSSMQFFVIFFERKQLILKISHVSLSSF